MIKKIELPTMTEDELEARMHSELGQYIPYNIDEVEWITRSSTFPRTVPISWMCCLLPQKRNRINDFSNILRLAGFDPFVVDVDFFALSNSFEATYGFGR